MGRRNTASSTAGAWYLPQVEEGLRAGIARFVDRIPSFGADTLAALNKGTPFAITSASVEAALLRSGDRDTWRRWRAENPSGDPWQAGGTGAAWIYDPRTARLQPADWNREIA